MPQSHPQIRCRQRVLAKIIIEALSAVVGAGRPPIPTIYDFTGRQIAPKWAKYHPFSGPYPYEWLLFLDVKIQCPLTTRDYVAMSFCKEYCPIPAMAFGSWGLITGPPGLRMEVQTFLPSTRVAPVKRFSESTTFTN